MVMFMQSQVNIGSHITRSLYLQDKLKQDHDQIKYDVNKLLVKQEEQPLPENDVQPQEYTPTASPAAQEEEHERTDSEASTNPVQC